MTRGTPIRAMAATAAGLCMAAGAEAGPFLPPSLLATDPAIVAWADGVASFAPAPAGSEVGAAANALGAANGTFASLGELDAAAIAAGEDPGTITLTFSTPVRNGVGGDLAVFENAFSFSGLWFAELAYVEVSTDGVHFARFPSVSLNTEGDLNTDFGRSFALLDPTNTHHLAGIHPQGVGTLFDLDALLDDPLVIGGLLDLASVGLVRIVDVPGDGSFLDSLGNPILDAWPTTGTGGFDLDALAALHLVPEPGTALLCALGLIELARRRRAS